MIYRVKVKNSYGGTTDETFWTEEDKARREFDSAKDFIKSSERRSVDIFRPASVDLDSFSVDTGSQDHEHLDSFPEQIKLNLKLC